MEDIGNLKPQGVADFDELTLDEKLIKEAKNKTKALCSKERYENGSGPGSREAMIVSDDRGLSSGVPGGRRQKGGGANADYKLEAMVARPDHTWTIGMLVDDKMDAYWEQGVSAPPRRALADALPLLFRSLIPTVGRVSRATSSGTLIPTSTGKSSEAEERRPEVPTGRRRSPWAPGTRLTRRLGPRTDSGGKCARECSNGWLGLCDCCQL